MYIKIGKAEFKFPGWAFIAGLLVADNMYANHCKKKAVVEMCDAAKDEPEEDEEDEES